MSTGVSKLTPSFQGITTALHSLPLISGKAGTRGKDMFAAQIPVPGNPDGPPLPPPSSGGIGLPTLPGIDLLPPIDSTSTAPSTTPLLPSIGPPLTPLGGSGGTGNRMVLFNRRNLVFKEGPAPYYRARISSDPANTNSPLVENSEKRYYWLPDGSLLETSNDYRTQQIISVNGAGTESSVAANANHDELIAWGRNMALKGGLLPVNDTCRYARGGNTTPGAGEFLLVPGNRGEIYYTGGLLGPTGGSRLNLAGTASETFAITPEQANTAAFIKRMGLRPRRHSETVLGAATLTQTGAREKITAEPNQWIQINRIQSTRANTTVPADEIGGVFSITSGGESGYIITQSLTNDTTRPSPYEERNNCPGKIRYTFDPGTGEVHAQIRRGFTSDWVNLNYLNKNFFYVHNGEPIVLTRGDSNSFWYKHHLWQKRPPAAPTSYRWEIPSSEALRNQMNGIEGNPLIPKP